MKYRVILAPQAEADVRGVYRYIRAKGAPGAAKTWSDGIRKKIRSLSVNPERATLAPESKYLDEPVREVFYGHANRGTYRILFLVRANTVYVLRIRHGSMLPAPPQIT